ncbi:MAG: aminotransferase class I/II-fold pyridoxal phosphate-dependent enzyme, partial [Betaproteobacteria bacterium]
EQLDISANLTVCLAKDDYLASDGSDCRNYGGLDGIPEFKELCASILEVAPSEVIVGGNSSLAMMYDLLALAMLQKIPDSETPWGKLPKVKFLCPSPGYDRHFAMCEHFGMEMITINMLSTGPDMQQIERLVAEDAAIKGIWCNPQYSNPTGITFSDDVVNRLASMPTKAMDFRIFWDNAYVVHHLSEPGDKLANISEACKKANNPNRAFVFSSTSKYSFPGAGIAMMASSQVNIDWLKKNLIIRYLGPDKMNQLRHMRFFKDMDGIKAHMRKHADIIGPKFELVLETLESSLGGKEIASWTKPKGGYFISLDTLPGCAKKVVAKAAEAGVMVTAAGPTYPYGIDPEDKNIRLAPTLPSVDDLKQAMKLFVTCVLLVSAELELSKRNKSFPDNSK